MQNKKDSQECRYEKTDPPQRCVKMASARQTPDAVAHTRRSHRTNMKRSIAKVLTTGSSTALDISTGTIRLWNAECHAAHGAHGDNRKRFPHREMHREMFLSCALRDMLEISSQALYTSLSDVLRAPVSAAVQSLSTILDFSAPDSCCLCSNWGSSTSFLTRSMPSRPGQLVRVACTFSLAGSKAQSNELLFLCSSWRTAFPLNLSSVGCMGHCERTIFPIIEVADSWQKHLKYLLFRHEQRWPIPHGRRSLPPAIDPRCRQRLKKSSPSRNTSDLSQKIR